MFSGIVEEAATVVGLVKERGNLHITLKCSFTSVSYTHLDVYKRQSKTQVSAKSKDEV